MSHLKFGRRIHPTTRPSLGEILAIQSVYTRKIKFKQNPA